MIQVDLYYNERGLIQRFTVNGHAEANPEGFDQVCFAVSLVTQVIANGLEDVLHKKAHPDIRPEDGSLAIYLDEEPDELTEALLQTMVNGLRQLQKTYSKKYLSIKEHRR